MDLNWKMLILKERIRKLKSETRKLHLSLNKCKGDNRTPYTGERRNVKS